MCAQVLPVPALNTFRPTEISGATTIAAHTSESQSSGEPGCRRGGCKRRPGAVVGVAAVNADRRALVDELRMIIIVRCPPMDRATHPGWPIDAVDLAYGRKKVVEQLSLSLPRGSIGCLPRPLGLRQDHGAARGGRLRAGAGRADPARRRTGEHAHAATAARSAAHRHGVPGPCAVPAPQRGRQRGFRPARCGRCRGARAIDARHRGLGPRRPALSA